jgi:hypothetical protein
MASKNNLLGSGVEHKEEKREEKVKVKVKVSETIGWPKRLYHIDCLQGKVLQTLQEQNEYKKVGWVESPAFIELTTKRNK